MLGMSKNETMLGRDRGSIALTPLLMFVTGAALGGAAAALLTPYAGRDLRRQIGSRLRRRPQRTVEPPQLEASVAQPPVQPDRIIPVPEALGANASDVLAGDLPGSVGGLSAGAVGDQSERDL